MESAALKLDSPVAELGYPRAIQCAPLRPVFFMEEWELPFRKTLPQQILLPFAGFVDNRLRVHFEINLEINRSRHIGIRDFINPKNYYNRIAPELLGSSLLKDHRKLVGGFAGYYVASEGFLEVSDLAILSPSQATDMTPEDRNKVLRIANKALENLALWLGAQEMRSGASIVSHEKMQKNGWVKTKRKGLRNLWNFYKGSFPMCLRKKQSYYVKQLVTEGSPIT